MEYEKDTRDKDNFPRKNGKYGKHGLSSKKDKSYCAHFNLSGHCIQVS